MTPSALTVTRPFRGFAICALCALRPRLSAAPPFGGAPWGHGHIRRRAAHLQPLRGAAPALSGEMESAVGLDASLNVLSGVREAIVPGVRDCQSHGLGRLTGSLDAVRIDGAALTLDARGRLTELLDKESGFLELLAPLVREHPNVRARIDRAIGKETNERLRTLESGRRFLHGSGLGSGLDRGRLLRGRRAVLSFRRRLGNGRTTGDGEGGEKGNGEKGDLVHVFLYFEGNPISVWVTC